MKTFIFFVGISFLGMLSASALADTPTVIDCSAQSAQSEESSQTCRLAKKVLQGLLVHQANEEFPQELDLDKMIKAVSSKGIQLDSLKDYRQLDLEGKGNYLYHSLVRSTQQKAPLLSKPSIDTESQPKKNSFSLSTGTRGGGFDIPLDLWY